jgi:hypothetical protein
LVDPNVPEVAGSRYQSIANAITYAKTQSPSATNRWVIVVGDNNSENFDVPSFISIKGAKTGTRLTGTVGSEGTITTDIMEFVIEDCIVYDIDMDDATDALVLYNCTVYSSTPSQGILVIWFGGIIGTTNFSSCTQFFMVNSFCFSLGGTITLPGGVNSYYYNSTISGILNTITLNGGEFHGVNVNSNTINWNAGTYSFYSGSIASLSVNAGKTVTAVGTSITSLTMDGGTLTTKGCVIGTRSITGGTWNNSGEAYDNTDSGLVAEEMQAVIDELSSIVNGYKEIKEITKISNTALDARVATWREDRFDTCVLSNGKILVVYALNDNKMYYQIFDTDYTVDTAETELLTQSGGASIDGFDIRVEPIGSNWVVSYIIAANGPYYQIMTNAGGWVKNQTAATHADAACAYCDLAVYPDDNNFALAYNGAGLDGFLETFNAAGTSQDSVEFDPVGAVAGIAVEVLSDETIIIATMIATIELYVYDGSDPTALANDYTGGSFYNTTIVGFATSTLEVAKFDDDTFMVTTVDQGGKDMTASFKHAVVGTLGSGTRTLRRIHSNRIGFVDNFSNGVQYVNSLGHFLMMQPAVSAEPPEISLGFFNKEGNVVGSNGLDRTVQGVDIESARYCVLSGGRFFVVARNDSDSGKPYFFVYGVS